MKLGRGRLTKFAKWVEPSVNYDYIYIYIIFFIFIAIKVSAKNVFSLPYTELPVLKYI